MRESRAPLCRAPPRRGTWTPDLLGPGPSQKRLICSYEACSLPSSLPRRGAAIRVSWAPVCTLSPGTQEGDQRPRLSPVPALRGNPGKLSHPGGRQGAGFGLCPLRKQLGGRRSQGTAAGWPRPITCTDTCTASARRCADTCPRAPLETGPRARGQLPSPRMGSLWSTRVCPQGPRHPD